MTAVDFVLVSGLPHTDRSPQHRRVQLALAAALILTAQLMDHRNRWSPEP